jgi:hypothetical protein
MEMRCERYRNLYLRLPWLRTFLIKRHFFNCEECRREMKAGINDGAFFRADDLRDEDLWPALRERLSSLGQSAAVRPAGRRGAQPRPQARRLGPAFVPVLMLVLAVLVAVSYFGLKSLRTVSNSERQAGPRPAAPEVLTTASSPRPAILQAFIEGKRARVLIYVEPKNPHISLFWLEPSKE